ncbi:MAG: LCP family protein [Bacillota bacterium]|nr:LCP family protein [Bacillota bacterium]
MKGRRLSEEERRQREKEELSRQRIQDQAYRDAQRAIHARIYGEPLPPEPQEEEWLPVWEEPRSRRRIEEYDTIPRREKEYDTIPRRPREGGDRPPPPTGKRPAPAGKQPPRKRRKSGRRRALVIVLVVIAALMLLALAAHTILVRRPELPAPESQGEGVHPALLEAGRREDVYTFLLVGRDDGGGGNTDTIMVGCYDVKNGTLDVMSIYRDTLVDVPWEIKKINSVYNREGMEGLQEQVKNLIGYAPDYYFLMEMDIVAQLVDAIGGVDYEVPFGMHYDDPTQDLHIHFEPGKQHFNGEDAVKLLRWRKNNSGENRSVGDVGRVEIQHDFLKAMMSQALSISTLTNIADIARIVDQNLTSNLSYGEMMWFGERFLLMNKEGLRFHTMPGDATGSLWSPTYQNYQSYVFVNDGALLELVNSYMNPYTTAITADMQHVIHGTTVDNLSDGQYVPVE